MKKKFRVELPNLKGALLSTEDKIFETLAKEKGASKYEISKATKIPYTTIRAIITLMENKGYVVEREYSSEQIYYLTAAGVYELEYRFNYNVYKDLHEKLLSLNYDSYDVERFLKNRFYRFYVEGIWEEDTLSEQFKEWCQSNGIEYSNGKRLVPNKK